MGPIVTELRYGFENVIEGPVGVLLNKPRAELGAPPSNQFLDAAHVQIAIMNVRLDVGHQARQKTAILANAITTERGPITGYERFQKR